MASSDSPLFLPPKKFKQWQENWAAWPMLRLGETLYARHKTEENPFSITQRAGCFVTNQVQKSDREWDFLRLHLTARHGPESVKEISSEPVLVPVIELRSRTKTNQLKYIELKWEPLPAKPLSTHFSTAQIAPQTATLFCQQYCQLPAQNLGEIFEGNIGLGSFRVAFFDFSEPNKDKRERAQSIEKRIKAEVINKEYLRIFFGVAATSPSSPYGLKPILKASNKNDALASFTSDDEEDGSYDHTQQCPPLC